MTTDTDTVTAAEPDPTLSRRTIEGGEARVATFTRTFATDPADLWDACTNPERLSRWYTRVSGDFRLGGTFEQELMGSATIVECEAPTFVRLSLGGGNDEIQVRISPGGAEGTSVLELQHATTFDTHVIGGEMFDAIFCMGGGYYPRFAALAAHLAGELPADYDSTTFHMNPDMRPAIDRGLAAMQALLDADAAAS
ncbi:MAG: hypothetical protein JWM86_432 [Thermoleophilia bacterium]|nr:hypothetical protein [Thermoleophilia bacterium]